MRILQGWDRRLDKYIGLRLTMGLSLFIALCSIGVLMLQNGGVFILKDDFREQQIAFHIGFNHFIKSNFGEWAWNVGLGTSTIGGYSFYTFSIPLLLSVLLPARLFPFLIGWIYIVMYVASSAGAYVYLKYVTGNKMGAMLGAILYAFSGAQNINMMFHFGTVIVLFPLLLYQFERLHQERKWVAYVITVALCCGANYYLFLGQVIFLALYGMIRYGSRDLRNTLRFIGRSVLYSVWGILLAGVVFIPSVLFTLGNKRTGINMDAILGGIGIRPFMETIRAFLFPAEPMGQQSSITINYDSVGMYLPFIGIAFALAYIMRKRDRNTVLAVILLVASFLSPVYMVFSMWTDHYFRWWYMLALMLCVLSAEVVKDIKEQVYPLQKAIVMCLIGEGIFVACFFLLNQFAFGGSILFSGIKFCMIMCVGVVSTILLLIWNKRRNYILLVLAISLVAILTTYHMGREYITGTTETAEEYLAKVELGSQLKNIDDAYRYRLQDNELIFAGDAIGTGIFSSTVSSSIAEFEGLFDYSNPNTNMNLSNVAGCDELMAAKYEIIDAEADTSQLGGEIVQTISVGGKTYYVVAHDVCPMGFACDTYISQQELMTYPVSERGRILLESICLDVNDANQSQLFDVLEAYQPEQTADKEIAELVSEKQAVGVVNFSRDSKGFQCETEYERDEVVFFSVPYDKGWSAYVDQTETLIYKVEGMMCIVVPQGKHAIQFKYHTPGMTVGLWMTCLGAIGMIVVAFVRRRMGCNYTGNDYNRI